MSLNTPSLSVSKVMDPRLFLDQDSEYVALKGAQVNSWQAFPATTINNSQIQITCNPPSRGIAVSRLVFLRCVYNITITGTNTVNPPVNLLQDGAHGPRSYPITSTIQSMQMSINNDT